MNHKALLPLLGFCLALLSSCSHIKEPEFRRIEGFKVKSFGLSEVKVGFKVTYFNPNNFGVTAKEAHVDVYLDSLFVGNFTSDSAVPVRRNADFSIPLTGTIPVQKAMELNLPQMAQRDVLIRANGSIKVGKAGIYVTEPIKYEGKHSIYALGKFYDTQ